jgi:carboxymethylenebutenolidase
MGGIVRLVAADGHSLAAYRADPPAASRGAVVVVQEVFGVNGHIRDVCDGFAAAGYTALAPALFDRIRSGVELDYDEAGIAEGRELAAAIGWDDPVHDIRAAAAGLRPDGRVGAVGYCWGASWTWVAACRLDLACAVCYYGRHIAEHLDETPRCPVMLHFGADDASIPPVNIERVRAAFPALPIHVYAAAGHGFNCDRRNDYRPEAARLAWERTLALFAEHLR